MNSVPIDSICKPCPVVPAASESSLCVPCPQGTYNWCEVLSSMHRTGNSDSNYSVLLEKKLTNYNRSYWSNEYYKIIVLK